MGRTWGPEAVKQLSGKDILELQGWTHRKDLVT